MNLLLQDTYAEVLDDEVVEDERVTRRADTETNAGTAEVDGQTKLLAPCTVEIGDSEDLMGMGKVSHSQNTSR